MYEGSGLTSPIGIGSQKDDYKRDQKRLYVKDEDKSKSTHFKRRDNNWYQTITKMSKGNLNKLFGGQVKFKTYGEFKDEIKK